MQTLTKEQIINQIIEKLQTNPLFAIDVIDTSTLKKIVVKGTGSKFIESYGTIEAFFESLFSKGITQFAIRTYKKHGTSYIDGIEPLYTINLMAKPVEMPIIQPLQMPHHQPIGGLNGVTQLGMAEYVDLNFKSREHSDLKIRNEILEARNKDLEAQNKLFEQKEFQRSVSLEEEQRKDLRNDKKWDKALEIFQNFAPLVMEKISGNSSVAQPEMALSSPEMSENNFVQFLNTQSKETINFLELVYLNASQNPEFHAEVKELLNKHSHNKDAHYNHHNTQSY
jgi:hypothetical protein